MVTALAECSAETERIRAIAQGADRLLQKMAPHPGDACVWCLLEVVRPESSPARASAPRCAEHVEISLVPLTR